MQFCLKYWNTKTGTIIVSLFTFQSVMGNGVTQDSLKENIGTFWVESVFLNTIQNGNPECL